MEPTSSTDRRPLSAGAGSGSSERGFTLIEVVIASVLLVIVLGVATSGLLGSLRGATGAGSAVAGDAAMARAASALSDDVMRATTADRRNNLLRDPFELQVALQHHADAYSSDLSNPGKLDIDDIVLATPSKLVLKADVSPGAGSECITWAMQNGPAKTMEMNRRVEQTCGGNLVERRVIFSSRKLKGQVNPAPFTYRLLCNRSQCPGLKGPNCQPWMDATPAAKQLRWIVGVEASFKTVTTGRAAAEASTTVRASIRSREAESYRRGLGC